MGDIPNSLLEALVVGEFVAEHTDINETDVFRLIARVGGVSSVDVATTLSPYTSYLRKVSMWVIIKKDGAVPPAEPVGGSNNSTAIYNTVYLERMRGNYIDQIKERLDRIRPVLEDRLADGNPSAEQLSVLRDKFNAYCRKIIGNVSRDAKENIWLRSLLLYKVLEGIKDLNGVNILPIIEAVSGIKKKDIKSDRRYQNISSVRQVACCALRNLGIRTLSYHEIRRVVKLDNHTSVITACRNVERKLRSNGSLLTHITNGGELRRKTDFYEEAAKRTDRRLQEVFTLAERLIDIKNLSSDNILDEACRIAGTSIREVRFGYSSQTNTSVKIAVSYVGRCLLGIKFESLAEMLGYQDTSTVRGHYYKMRDLLQWKKFLDKS